MSNTAFGPQGSNAATALPQGTTVNRYGTRIDTWVKDASSAAACDGTVLDAAFFNNIIGNLRYLVTTAGVAKTDGDMTLVYDAVKAISPTIEAGTGTQVTENNGTFTINLGLGAGNLTFFTS